MLHDVEGVPADGEGELEGRLVPTESGLKLTLNQRRESVRFAGSSSFQIAKT
jgi:hypothetical protein